MQISETFVDDQVKLVAQFGYPIKLTVIFALRSYEKSVIYWK